MIKHALLTTALLIGTASPLLAQSVPFDMTPESDLRVAPAPVPSTTAPQPVLPPAAVTPQRSERFILPSASVRLAGEESRQSVAVYLTQAQAEAPARLQLSYLNAIVVAPEISRLQVGINGTEVALAPIMSSSGTAAVAVDLPPGLLQAGANTITFAASQRHRTDCSIDSTFELWTEITSSTATLSFDGAGLDEIRQLSDLAAIGVDATGQTTVRLISTDIADQEASRVAMGLAQQLALVMRVPNLHFEQAETPSTQLSAGVLDVVLAPADQLPVEMATIAAQARSGPVALLMPQTTGAPTLVVSGPNWNDVARAGDAVLAAAPLAADRPRVDLPNAIPVLLGGQTAALSAMGVPTTQFNGRRFSTQFQFELPSDFYANRYGEAELILDAAYSADVQPGSEITIFTNTEIASATPLLRTDGGLLRNTVIRIPMTNLRPGRNEVDVVVNLRATSDEVCSPGWTGTAPVRFVFSSGSQFHMPDYARAASLPDLEVMTGSAWPYSDEQLVPLALGAGADTKLAAMTLMARTAAASGKVLPITLVPEAQLQSDQNAIVVMPLPAMSGPTASRIGLTRAATSEQLSNESAVLDQFRARDGQSNVFMGAAEWVLNGVGLSLADLRILPQREAEYALATGDVVMAQAMQPEGGLWTVLTSTDESALRSGMLRLAVTEQWRQVAGRVSVLGQADSSVHVIPVASPSIGGTQLLSPMNLRMVAANWFSGNILAFTAALAIIAVLLMLSTALVLSKSGRQ